MEVEDEAHLVFECPRYHDLREKYILVDYDVHRNSQDQLVELLQCRDRKKLDNLAIYLRKAFEVHEKYAEAYFENTV